MFTGIIKQLEKQEKLRKKEQNVHFTLVGPFTQELKIDKVWRIMVVALQ